MKVTRHSNDGFSLVEVMIAVLILTVVGGILLNGLINQQKTTGKVVTNSQSLSDLSSAAESIAAAPYVSCGISQDATNLNPYKNVARADLVQIDSVAGLTKAREWKACGDSAWASEAPMIQRVVISTPVSTAANSRRISRTVLKYFSGSAASYDQNYKVNKLQFDLGPATSSDATKTTSTKSLTVTQDQSLTCFFLFPAAYNGITASIPSANSCGASAKLTISLDSAATGTYLVDVGAFNQSNGNLAIVGTMNIVVRPPLAINTTVVNTAGTTTNLLCDGFKNSMTVSTTSTKNPFIWTYKDAPCKTTVSEVTGTGEGGFVFTSYSVDALGYAASDIVVGTLPSGATSSTPFTTPVSVSANSSLTITLSLKSGTVTSTSTKTAPTNWTDLCSSVSGKPQTATVTLNFKQSTESTLVIPVAIRITC